MTTPDGWQQVNRWLHSLSSMDNPDKLKGILEQCLKVPTAQCEAIFYSPALGRYLRRPDHLHRHPEAREQAIEEVGASRCVCCCCKLRCSLTQVERWSEHVGIYIEA